MVRAEDHLMQITRDQNGGVLVEATVMIPIIFIFFLGAIDFLFAFYQWNQAAKAVETGLRIAAVSSPVSNDIPSITGVGGSVYPGDPMPVITTRVCTGSNATCTGGSGSTYDATAMNWIVFGRGRTSCGAPSSVYYAGMCNFFARVQPLNVRITYSHSASDGLGYAGRPGGPVVTTTLSLENLQFQFFFLGGLMNFANINMPGMTSTMTSEDLSSNRPSS